MTNAILIQDVQVGQKFYMLNKKGISKYNGNMTFVMTSNNGRYFEYDRVENDRRYNGTTLYEQYVIVIE